MLINHKTMIFTLQALKLFSHLSAREHSATCVLLHINSKYVETKHCTWGHSQSMNVHWHHYINFILRTCKKIWGICRSYGRSMNWKFFVTNSPKLVSCFISEVDFGKNESCHDDIQHQCFDLISSVTKGEGFLWISTIYIMDWPLLPSMPILSSSSYYWLFRDKIQPCQINARSFCMLHTNYFLIRLLSVRQSLLLW